MPRHPAFQQVDHRPWPLPAGRWAWRQSWRDLLFAHWPAPVAAVRRLVPPGLAIDTFDGATWVGVVPFRMAGVMRRPLPDLPWVSAFPELNVRVYVTAGGKPGVWFLSLDATNFLAVVAARALFHLPYYRAEIDITAEGEGFAYRCVRTDRRPPAADPRVESASSDADGTAGSASEWADRRPPAADRRVESASSDADGTAGSASEWTDRRPPAADHRVESASSDADGVAGSASEWADRRPPPADRRVESASSDADGAGGSASEWADRRPPAADRWVESASSDADGVAGSASEDARSTLNERRASEDAHSTTATPAAVGRRPSAVSSAAVGGRSSAVVFEAHYRPTSPVYAAVPGTLEHWLTERYCLYAEGPDGALTRTEVHHRPWPLQHAAAEITANTIAAAGGLPVAGPPTHLHFAKRIDVVVWGPQDTKYEMRDTS